jgi:hypothetical protein
MKARTFASASALAGVLLVTGCGGHSSNGSPSSSNTSTHQLDESSNGKHLAVHFGDTIVVTLHSTYWTFGVPGGFILQPITPPQVGKGVNCPSVPGSGCGTVTITYNVGKVGSGSINARRTTCGEALKCTAAQSTWSVTIQAT